MTRRMGATGMHESRHGTNDEDIRSIAEAILGTMGPAERIQLASEFVLARIVCEEPFILMDSVSQIGFLTFLAQSALNLALSPEDLMAIRDVNNEKEV